MWCLCCLCMDSMSFIHTWSTWFEKPQKLMSRVNGATHWLLMAYILPSEFNGQPQMPVMAKWWTEIWLSSVVLVPWLACTSLYSIVSRSNTYLNVSGFFWVTPRVQHSLYPLCPETICHLRGWQIDLGPCICYMWDALWSVLLHNSFDQPHCFRL